MTHPTPDLDKLEVTQADRDALRRIISAYYWARVEPDGDFEAAASEVARHRIASARREQALREALEDLPRQIELQRTIDDDLDAVWGWNAGLERAAAIARAALSDSDVGVR